MRKQTKDIKKQLQSLNTLEEKINLLKDTYKGEGCYILTSGPSMKDYTSEYLREKLKNKLVIAVKQTYNIAPDIVDFHLLNTCNYQPYNYKDSKPIVMMVEIAGSTAKTPELKPDLTLYIDKTEASKEKSLSISLEYEKYLFTKSLKRPFGPGILHEIGIYLPILLGCKKINIIGWDLGEPNNNEIKRFYEYSGIEKKIQKFIMDFSPSFYNRIYVRILNKINYIRYLLGSKNIVLNNPGITIGEAKFIAESTKELYVWLKSKNIDMSIVSKNSMVDSIVPRFEL
jgi:hypothetical protein